MTVLSTRTAADVHRERQRRKAEADALSADGAAASSATSDRRSSIVPKSHERRPIRLLHAFGSQSADIGSAVLLDDNNVLHRCGRWLVSQEIDATAVPTKLSPMDFFLELSPQVSRITAMSMAGNHKYVAVGEVCDEPPGAAPQLRIVHLQARRTMVVLSAALDGEFVGCAFSSDCKHVLAWTGAPEHVVVVWQWQEERPVGMYRSRNALSRVLFNPATATLLSLCSPMRLARLNDSGHFKEIEVSTLKRYGSTCPDHCWLAAKALVFLDGAGACRVVEDSTPKQTIACRHPAFPPTTLQPLSKQHGWLAGCADGQVLCYLKPEDGAEYALACCVRGPAGMGPVRALHVGETERHLLVHCAQICVLPLREALARAKRTSTEGAGDDEAAVERPTTGGGHSFRFRAAGQQLQSAVPSAVEAVGDGRYEPLLESAHTARIIGLSAAVAKPLLASCAEDQTLRVWDLQRHVCQFVARLPEQPQAVSFHPDGMQLALCLDTRISLYHVAMSGLLAWRDLHNPQGKCIAYSHGGHLLAASSGNHVLVFEAYSLTRIGYLSGHLAPITALAWAADDAAFSTGGADGMVYTWSCEGAVRVGLL